MLALMHCHRASHHYDPSVPGFKISTYRFLAPFFAAAEDGRFEGGRESRSSREAAVDV